MTRHDPLVYLQHMREYAVEVLSFVEGRGRTDLDSDIQFRFAVRYGVGMLGQAASKVPVEIQTGIPEVDWSAIIGMRHRLIHGYETVNHDVLWDAVQNDLPDLIEKLTILIERIEDDAETAERGGGNDSP